MTAEDALIKTPYQKTPSKSLHRFAIFILDFTVSFLQTNISCENIDKLRLLYLSPYTK